MLAQNIIAILAFALIVSASPLIDVVGPIIGGDGVGNQASENIGQNSANSVENSGNIGGDFTVNQSIKTCGNAQLNCCNKLSKKGDTDNSGVLGSLFGSGDVGLDCAPVGVPVLGAQVSINKACDAKAACCQGETHQNGVINLGCVALASLI